jgi:hypothetical protein
VNFADQIADMIATSITLDADPWEEEPVPLEVFLYDSGYLALPEFSDKQYEFLEVMDDDDPQTNKYTEAVLQWGKGSGKDYISGVFLARRAYKLLCLKDPARYHNLNPGSPIELLNVAYNATQAYTAFFKQFLNTVKDKRCFERYGYEPKSGSIVFGKNIIAYSGHSDKEGQEGLNLYAAVADEISAFKTDHELGLDDEDAGTAKGVRAKGAESIVKMLRSSIYSRFPKVGKLVLLSYPRYSGDYIQQAYDAGRLLKHVFTSFGATFDLRPDLKKEDLQAEYDRDPIEAAAKYECRPPSSRSSYHREEQVIHIYDEFMRQVFTVGKGVEEDELAPFFTPAYLGIDEDTPVYIHVDLALRHDNCGFAMSYIDGFVLRSIVDRWIESDPQTQRELERIGSPTMEYKPQVTIPLYTRWRAPFRGEIDFARPRKLIIQLRQRGFYIKLISFDQWQSVDSIQILRKMGFKCTTVSVDRDLKLHGSLRDVVRDKRLRTHLLSDKEAFLRYKDFFLEGRPDDENSEFRGKTLEHIEPLAAELLGLELINGAKVDHKTEQTGKDIADAVAAVTYHAVENAKRGVEATIFDQEEIRLIRGY